MTMSIGGSVRQNQKTAEEMNVAQGALTKENAAVCLDALNAMFESLPKSRKMENIGNLNEISLFLEQAKRELPAEKN